jgi:hypothetical protein
MPRAPIYPLKTLAIYWVFSPENSIAMGIIAHYSRAPKREAPPAHGAVVTSLLLEFLPLASNTYTR